VCAAAAAVMGVCAAVPGLGLLRHVGHERSAAASRAPPWADAMTQTTLSTGPRWPAGGTVPSVAADCGERAGRPAGLGALEVTADRTDDMALCSRGRRVLRMSYLRSHRWRATGDWSGFRKTIGRPAKEQAGRSPRSTLTAAAACGKCLQKDQGSRRGARRVGGLSLGVTSSPSWRTQSGVCPDRVRRPGSVRPSWRLRQPPGCSELPEWSFAVGNGGVRFEPYRPLRRRSTLVLLLRTPVAASSALHGGRVARFGVSFCARGDGDQPDQDAAGCEYGFAAGRRGAREKGACSTSS
jgi:hypothetical protein